MQTRLIFRAEANEVIGRGHLSRCIAVADMLKDELEIVFVVLHSNQNFVKSILTSYKLFPINTEDDFFSLLRNEDLLWIDGYNFTEDWKAVARNRVNKLIETNDIPYPAKNVDILFNHTPGLTKDMFRGGHSHTEFYLGLDYSLLRQSFLNIARTKTPQVDGKGVFICFGGADTFRLGEQYAKTLLETGFQDQIYWITAKPERTSFNYKKNNLTILYNLDEGEMISYMTKAKVLIIPSSVLSFEAIALRKPIFTCFFVENQALIYHELIKNGLAEGNGYMESKEQVIDTVNNLLELYRNDKKQLNQIVKQAAYLDGRSGERIKEIVIN